MAEVHPFRALRYDPAKTGALDRVITQPYDKITPAMLERYLGLSPYNLARVIKNTNYREAASHLERWKAEGVLRADPAPAIYPYFQTYTPPGGSGPVTRRGFIAAGRLEEYSAGIVFPHERTLAGPKQDRLELLRATRAHFGQIFVLYSDPPGEVDQLLSRATAGPPVEDLHDEYGFAHAVWRMDAPGPIEAVRRAMRDKKLLIADGHHRYETALAFRDECRQAGTGADVVSPDGHVASQDGYVASHDAVMMTFVNMEAPGLTILPTHRVVARMPGFDRRRFLESAGRYFDPQPIPGREAGLRLLGSFDPGQAIGVALAGAEPAAGPEFFLLRLRPQTDLAALLPGFTVAQRSLDVVVLHDVILKLCMGIDEQAVREEKFHEYVREAEKGWDAVAAGAPACFFLNPVRIGQMRDIAFAGGVLPQKSTDFFPKMLSGLTGYSVEG